MLFSQNSKKDQRTLYQGSLQRQGIYVQLCLGVAASLGRLFNSTLLKLNPLIVGRINKLYLIRDIEVSLELIVNTPKEFPRLVYLCPPCVCYFYRK